MALGDQQVIGDDKAQHSLTISSVMPFEHQLNKNPYRHSYFSLLKIGPHATGPQIIQQARELCKKMNFGEKLDLDGRPLDEHLVNDAAGKLRDPQIRIEEILLTHAPANRDQKRLKTLTNKLDELANLPLEQPQISLVHPLAVLWFLPGPGPEAASLPDWEELGFSKAGHKDDEVLDIVFDR